MNFRTLVPGFAFTVLLSAAGVLGTVTPAAADVPGAHPAYIHALRDLGVARFYLNHPSFGNVDRAEGAALHEIQIATVKARFAARDDGKNLNEGVNLDANLHHRERLLRALDALGAAHADIARYESNGYARRDQHSALWHIDRAVQFTRSALGRLRFDHRE